MTEPPPSPVELLYSGLYRLRGVVRPRRAGYLDDHTPVTCALNHEMWSNTVPCYGAVVHWCQHRACAGAPECGVPLYVDYQPDGIYVIDMDETEARGIQRERLRPSDVRRLLGVAIRDGRRSA